MPKVVINYNNTIIYKIVCNDLNIKDIYVGHTTNFDKRKIGHKSCCNNINGKSYHFNVYQCIRDNRGWDNWSMIEIEKYKCNDKYEACKRERHFIESLKATLNQNIPSRTDLEYKADNRDKILDTKAQYRIDNKDKILDAKAQYRINNKDKIKEHDRQYRIANREKIRAKAWQLILERRAKDNIV
jgi:hypothetical protein